MDGRYYGNYQQGYQQEGYQQGEYQQGGYEQGGGYQDQYAHLPPPPAPGQNYPTGGGYAPPDQPPYAPQPPQGEIHHTPRDQGGNYFEYSTCAGRRKALLVGINYFGTSGELAGCINDVHNVHRFICERFGYSPEDIVILTDDARDARSLPTRDNIVRGMQWLVEGAQRDDALFFHFSGHGTQTEDLDGDEGDGDDEAICPLDYETAGLIIDDDSGGDANDSHDMLVKPLPAGCRLTAIFDSCHSGTVMDLPYVYSTEGKIKEPNYFESASDNLVGAGMAAISGDTGGIMKSLWGAAKDVFTEKKAHESGEKDRTSPADVVMWSGCKDDQTSADTEEEGKATGAMSYAFIAALTKYPQQSYMQLLNTVRDEMRAKYTQKPQLSACHPIDVDLEFVA